MSQKQPRNYWAERRAKAKAGLWVGKCDCGSMARRILGGEAVCDRCAWLQHLDYAAELARGVCGYRSYGVLATTSGRNLSVTHHTQTP